MPRVPSLIIACCLLVSGPLSAGECDLGSPSVFKLESSPEMEALLGTMLGPMDLIAGNSGLSVVVVVVPLPCEERLTQVSVEIWDGFVVQKRSRGKRYLRVLAKTAQASRLPWLGDLMPPEPPHKLIRLQRSAALGKGLSWIGNVNRHAVIMFPVACNAVTGATLTLRTEREVVTRSGRFRKRHRTRDLSTFRIPSPTEPAHGLQALYSILDWEGGELLETGSEE